MIRSCLIAAISALAASTASANLLAQDPIPLMPMAVPADAATVNSAPAAYEHGYQTFDYGGAFQDPNCAACPPEIPRPEFDPGWNLYWHDPCNPGRAPAGCSLLQSYAENPEIYFTADFLPMMRDQSNELPFQALGSASGIALSTANFQPEIKAGVKAILGCALGDWYRLETVFLGGYQWEDFASVRDTTANGLGGTGNLLSPFSQFGNPALVSGLDYNNFASIAFRSRLNGSELNLRRRLAMPAGRMIPSETSFILGVRYLKVNETFNYNSQSNVPAALGAVNQYNVATDNDMIGPQVGVMSQILLYERTWVDFEIKGAAFNNHAQLQTLYTNTDNNGLVSVFPSEVTRDRNAFLCDLSLVFNHQFSRSLTFRFGYNAFWLSGLALGSENVNRDLNIVRNGPATVQHAGRITYHGPVLGLTWAF